MFLNHDIHQHTPSKSTVEPIFTDRPCIPNADHRSPVEISSPIQLVPTEVFTEIFSYLGPGDLDDIHIQAIVDECSQAAIIPPTHVCQRWRQIALSTPSLWNRITILVTANDSTKKVECVTSWLERGRDCPLFIKILCRGKGHNCQSGWDALLATVIGHSFRWQEAVFSAPFPFLVTDLTGIRNRLPLLQTLKLCLLKVNPPNAFEAAPMLRSIMDLNFMSLRSLSQLPWTQLTEVTVKGCSCTTALSMLKMMPRIVSFTSRLGYSANSPMTPPLCLPELRNLALYDGGSVDCFLDSLELPSLMKFSISEQSSSPPRWSTSLVSLIHRSGCYNIDILDLTLTSHSGSEPPSLDELLRATPKLKTLNMHNPSVTSHRHLCDHSMVRDLTASQLCVTGPYPAPELQTLFLDYWDNVEVQIFVDMVESRWRVDPGGPIKRIDSIRLRHIPGAAILEAVDMNRMREFVAEGLSIRVEVTSELQRLVNLGM
ncbi:hypothetical protein FIBSPDRAFT_1014178 [Athelia psychrophila]|uniref:F-box domain-containing protein n=1 Tax=Athelia psychrophila TaxID=1759441 RepID=A0A166M4G2_9AGAM|nr:hypothetical protein FIBSPDRAFT_1014178 [Fibularhizoctonia sp. CBS 109695]